MAIHDLRLRLAINPLSDRKQPVSGDFKGSIGYLWVYCLFLTQILCCRIRKQNIWDGLLGLRPLTTVFRTKIRVASPTAVGQRRELIPWVRKTALGTLLRVNLDRTTDCCGWYPVAQEIGNLPFSEIFRPMSGNRSIAEAVGSDLQRQLRPRCRRPRNRPECRLC